jgi:hypothetical protein
MTGLDSNILVQLAFQDHPANAATVAAVQAEARSGNRLMFPSAGVRRLLSSNPTDFAVFGVFEIITP